MENVMNLENLRYPIGKFQFKGEWSESLKNGWIQQIAEAPADLRKTISGLSEDQLDTPYRPGGWTVRQVVHHIPDSHMNSYIRFKLALTEEEPLIKTYDEAKWAELSDTPATPIETSLVLLEALHQRWVHLLQSMQAADFSRVMLHPEIGKLPLSASLGLYAWHGRHHIAQIDSLKERSGW